MSEWERRTFEELFNISSGKSVKYSKDDSLNYDVYGSNGKIGTYSGYNFDDGFLIGRVGAVGFVHKISHPIWASDNTLTINLKNRTFTNKDYIDYLLTHLDLKKYSTKTAQPLLTQKGIKKIQVQIPPVDEQQKIAAILSSVDEAIEKTEQILEQTETMKKGLMQQLLTKGIRHSEFKDTTIGKIPFHWNVVDLIEVADKEEKYSFVGGPFGSDLTSKEYTENGVRIIQLQNIGDGQFNDNYKIYTTDEKANQLYKCNIFPGDIIIAKMAEPVARACIIPNSEKRFLMASDGIRLKVDEKNFDRNFILHAINSPYFRNQAINNSTGTTRLRIGLKTLRSLKIATPPLDEQIKISRIFDNIEDSLRNDREKLNTLNALKQGLMQQLLTGKVRVPLDEKEGVPS
uniref:restriction endonuclease subunit S n=1 Tax=uncultured Allobacillus sp. TaxID=1638025 RepID=UPI002599142A|nr:restriction endonuclease subunit S [uncultured Allobacillus sp.]